MNKIDLIKRLVNIYMNDFKKDIKDYSIINYFNYNYHHSVDIKYIDIDNVKTILTIDINITSDKMLNNILKDQSIKKHLI